MSELPPPLVGPEVDLRAFDWFPFYHKRLRQSSFWKRASDLACRISVDLEAEAFEQVPAGSVPDDNYILAEWAGFGRRNIDEWLAVKDEVMSAWTRCSDERWYHPTLCEVARAQWAERQQHLWERDCDRIRKSNVRRAKDGLEPLPLPPKPSDEQGEAAQAAPTCGRAEGSTVARTSDEPLSDGNAETSDGRLADVPGLPAENALKGKGKGKGKGKEDIDPSPAATADRPRKPAAQPRKHPYPPDAFPNWYVKYPRKQARAEAEKAFQKIEAADDTPFGELLTGIDRFWTVQPDLKFWPHPASWLNGRRWDDEPSLSSEGLSPSSGPRVEFAGGVSWPTSTVSKQVERWRDDPATWPEGTLGPPPFSPGCRVPDHLLRVAA